MSIAQLHQLARQIKQLRRIREQTKIVLSQKPVSYRPSNIQPSWGADLGINSLTGSNVKQPKAAQNAKKPRKSPQKPKQPSSKSK